MSENLGVTLSSEDLAPINFDTTKPVEVPVTIEGKRYVLREASGDAGCRYRNYLLDNTEFEEGKPKRTRGMANLEPLLVSLCLFELVIGPDGDVKGEKPVNIATVRSWPSHIQKTLYTRAKAISGLNETEETVEDLEKKLAKLKAQQEAAKNEQSGTMDGCD